MQDHVRREQHLRQEREQSVALVDLRYSGQEFVRRANALGLQKQPLKFKVGQRDVKSVFGKTKRTEAVFVERRGWILQSRIEGHPLDVFDRSRPQFAVTELGEIYSDDTCITRGEGIYPPSKDAIEKLMAKLLLGAGG